MDWKQVVEREIRKQEDTLAREAVREALRVGVPGTAKIGEVLVEMEEEPRLWSAFTALSLDDLRSVFSAAEASTAYGPPGPDRRHGITANRIIAYVGDHSGCSLGDIARSLGLKRGAVTSQMRTLRSEGRLRVEGQERRFRYFVG